MIKKKNAGGGKHCGERVKLKNLKF